MSSIPWYAYRRREADPAPMTEKRRRYDMVVIRPSYAPAEFMETVYAENRDEALREARKLCPSKGIAVDVVAHASWRALSDLERSVFLGTFKQPVFRPEAETVNGIRISGCKVCGQPIMKRRTDPNAHTGRPLLYHEKCAPASVIAHRNAAARKRARKAAERKRARQEAAGTR